MSRLFSSRNHLEGIGNAPNRRELAEARAALPRLREEQVLRHGRRTFRLWRLRRALRPWGAHAAHAGAVRRRGAVALRRLRQRGLALVYHLRVMMAMIRPPWID
jgi:hypothetical protein